MHVLAPWGSPRRFAAFLAGIVPVAVMSSLALSAPLPASAATVTTGSLTPASLLKEAAAAIDAQRSAHIVFDASSSSATATAENIVGDVGTQGGTETVTDGAAVLTVRVTSTDSYISGTPTGLTTLFGLTAAQATKVGARWEFWKSGSLQYKSLKKVVTVHSLLSLLPKAKGTTLSTAGSVYTLTWNTAATSREPALANALTIPATGAKLPMVETSTDTAGEKVTTTVSMWGETLHVHAPSSKTTIAASVVSR